MRVLLALVVALAACVVAVVGSASAQESAPTCDAPTPTPTPTPTPSGAPPPIPSRVDGPAGVVALTFDAGADSGYAQDILDTLLDEQVPATFGMTGRWAEANPEFVERMAAEGHIVINHTYDHRSFTGLSDHLHGLGYDDRLNEILTADAVIAPLIGHSTCPWYRVPYGDRDAAVASQLADIGWTNEVGWTVDTLGWRGAPVQDIVSRSLRLAAPNAIYVMHVGIQSRDGPALQLVIEGLRAAGYGFATVAALEAD